MNDLYKNEKIEKAKSTGAIGFDTHMELLSEFHDRLTKLEAIANFTCLVESQDGVKPTVMNQKPGEAHSDFMAQAVEKNPPLTEPHLGMIDLEAFSKLHAENEKLRKENVNLAKMFWDEVAASILWKQKYETSYNELRALKMATK